MRSGIFGVSGNSLLAQQLAQILDRSRPLRHTCRKLREILRQRLMQPVDQLLDILLAGVPVESI